jgi:hypothetical protein
MKIIPLDSDDDIISICDRLEWAGESQVLLLLPEEGEALLSGLDLVRLRRFADGRRIEVGLVTAVSSISRQAKALGIPTFASVEAAERSRRGWWRGRRRSEVVGLPTVGGVTAVDLRPQQVEAGNRGDAQSPPTPLNSPGLWALRYLTILLFFLAAALLVVAFSYLVPGATVTLTPETLPLSVTQEILVDPQIDEIDYGRFAIPGRILQVEQSWQTGVETSGVVEVPGAAARGTVLFTNRLEEEALVPAGTQLSTGEEGGVVFQTLAEVVVPGVEGGTAEADVIAIEPGPQGNVAAGRIITITGKLNEQLEVRNPEPTAGGDVGEAAAVAEADLARLRSQALQFLQAASASEMEAQLMAQEFLARDSLRVVEVGSETFSHAPGEQTDRVTLEMRAQVAGTAVDATEASGLVYEALAAQVPAGFTLVPESIRFSSGEVVGVDEAGRVTVEMLGEAAAAPELALAAALEAVAGQEPQIAAAYLYEELSLREAPQIRVWPNWFNLLPFLASRIEVETVGSGQ